MQVCVLSGSPQGHKSVTLQYLRYIEKKRPIHTFNVFHVGRDIRAIQRDPTRLHALVEGVAQAEAVLWVFPVYFALVPSQLKQAIELLSEAPHRSAFVGKHATALSTSVHFYDHTAHDYLHAISMDLGLRYVRGFSPESEDLMQPEMRARLLQWFDAFCDGIRANQPGERLPLAAPGPVPAYEPWPLPEAEHQTGDPILLLTDGSDGPEDENLRRMIAVFRRHSPRPVTEVHLADFGPRGGCLGCLRCGEAGQCTYTDSFAETYRRLVLPAPALVIAGRLRDRFLSSAYKQFLDRSFFNNHMPVLRGKSVGFLVSGRLSSAPFLREAMEGILETNGAQVCGWVSDEQGDAADITGEIRGLAGRMGLALDYGLRRPGTYRAVGAHRIFRDMIYQLKNIFVQDYNYYSKNGMLDYPNTRPSVHAMRLFSSVGFAHPRLNRWLRHNLPSLRLRPFKSLVEKA